MNTKEKLNIKTLAVFLILFTTSAGVFTQNSSASSRSASVKPLSDFFKAYKNKHITISEKIESNTKLSFAEKLATYENEVSKIREEFKKNRSSEYLSKTAKRAKRYSCTGTHIRNTTECAPVYINAPNSNMYTTKDWVNNEGENTVDVTIDSSNVSLRMKAIGKRTYKGVLYATFKYIPEKIPAIVNKETTELFNQMVEK